MEIGNFRLHPDTIAEVKERVDLVEIVSDYVVIQKKGRQYTGLCPFHDEKTPSFTVNPTKQLYYCFGCGAGGGAIKFLMEIGKQSFKDVILNLAQRYQIPVKTLGAEEQKEIQKQISLQEQLYEILAVANYFYQHSLQQEEGKFALDYLLNQRGLSKENIEEYKLGYAPSGWNTLYNYLVEIKNYPLLLVEQAGLIRKKSKGDGYIDYFRDRLTIPIQDNQGRIIAFGARSLDGSEPKYLNSPETDLFSKSKTLFGINYAQSEIIKQDKVIVVEGYFDAIALQLAGIKNVVAVLGTALTEKHIKQLSRYTQSKEIIVNFDADKAGVKATERAIKEVESLVYAGQIKLKILTIPEGKDADEFLKSDENSINKYQELISKAPLWLDWQIEQLIEGYNLTKSDDYEIVFSSLSRLLNKISNQATRDHYLSSCAEILSSKRSNLIGLNSEEFKRIYQSLKQSLKQFNNGFNRKKYYKSLGKSFQNQQTSEAEFLLLLVYIHCPSYREQILDLLEEKDLVFSLAHHRFLWQKIHEVPVSQVMEKNTNYLLLTLQETIIDNSEFNQLLIPLYHLQENKQPILSDPSHYVQAAIASLETINLEKYKQYCQQKYSEFSQENNYEKMDFYQQEIINAINELERLKSLRKD
ncbi:DNA primase [Cyanobacterium aponinum UTEX 3222]|uniref:DNA primase n=1 Tax=Cyanobacterium aponinum TaxID=379064 RepID=UPI00308857DF|nr:DNA primase [Cyanobacterium aponinum UTEX 3222]